MGWVEGRLGERGGDIKGVEVGREVGVGRGEERYGGVEVGGVWRVSHYGLGGAGTTAEEEGDVG